MTLKNKQFMTNASQLTRVMVQCRTRVNRDAVTRKSIDGVEHIIVSSSTLPDDIVMNGGLYPAEEITKAFETLELTLAPVEHPIINGQFISANDPRAIHDFHAGAFNMNVRRENGRVHVDKFINVAEAIKTDRGKRLLDRIDELENNSDPRPIHTSVGVFLTSEELIEPQTNAHGDEFTWIARDMVIDHDAILLDSVAAAQPHQGVGIAVNRQGEEYSVDEFTLPSDAPEPFNRIAALSGNNEHQSVSQMEKAINEAFERSAIDAHWIEEIFPDDNRVIFHSGDQLFEVEFVIDSNGLATIVGIPLPVERDVTFTPKTNHSEGNDMKDLMLKALVDAGITVNADISDADLLAQYNQLQSNSDGAGDDEGIAAIVANAVTAATKPLAEQIDSLQAKLNSDADAELIRLAELIGNSDKYPGIDNDAAKLLGVDTLKGMATNCRDSFGIPGMAPINNNDAQSVKTDMPE